MTDLQVRLKYSHKEGNTIRRYSMNTQGPPSPTLPWQIVTAVWRSAERIRASALTTARPSHLIADRIFAATTLPVTGNVTGSLRHFTIRSAQWCCGFQSSRRRSSWWLSRRTPRSSRNSRTSSSRPYTGAAWNIPCVCSSVRTRIMFLSRRRTAVSVCMTILMLEL